MKIALVILHADPQRGGAERYTYDLATALRGGGHSVAVVASSFAAGQHSEADVLLDTGSQTRLGHYVGFLDQLDRHLGETRYDIVHAMLPVRQCDIYHPHAGIAAETIAGGHLKYEGPVMQMVSRVATRLNLRRKRFAAVERTLLSGPRPPLVLCLSDYVKHNVERHYDLPESRLATLINAVDIDRFDPSRNPGAGRTVRDQLGISAERIVALMIAQDFSRKGVREAIQSMAAANDARLDLLVVGKQDPAPYRRLAEQLGVASRVIFAGQADDPYGYYRAADFFLLPTRHDPCSLVVLEALAMGLPVVSTARNGACEVMSTGVHGFVVQDPADITTLAESIRSLLDPPTRLKMGAACRELRPKLAYHNHLEALLSIYAAQQNRGQ